MFILFTLQMLLFFALRFLLLGTATRSGSDSCALLLGIDAFRQQKRRDIRLPGTFLLEEEYSEYPPLFFYLLGWVPQDSMHRYHWAVNHVFDLAVLVVLDLFLWGAGADGKAILLANLVYSLIPTLSVEYRALTTRSLSALLYVMFMLALYASFGNAAWLGALVVLFFLIFITHKLTLQLTVVTCVFFAATHGWQYALVPLAGCALAWAVMRETFVTLALMHVRIITFWHRHKYQQLAHAVRHSPVYGTPLQRKPTWRDVPDLRTATMKLLAMGAHNPFLITLATTALPWGVLAPTPPSELGPVLHFCTLWAWLVLGWAALTTDVPYFRSLGDGYRYVKYASFPMAVLACWTPWPLWPLWTVGGVASLYILLRNFRHMRRESAQRRDGFDDLLQWLHEHPQVDRIGAIPVGMCDYIAYKCHRTVLWGSHFSFPKGLSDVFPVLTKPLDELTRTYDLRYWIIDTDYTDLAEVGQDGVQPLHRVGHYAILSREQVCPCGRDEQNGTDPD